jgi:DNA-binding beta-propeller fold protein YncE
VTVLELFRRNVTVLRGFASPYDVEFSPDGRWAHVTEDDGGRVAVVSATRRRVVARVPAGRGPHGLAVSPDGRRVWVTHGPSARAITILDTSRPSRPRANGGVAAPGDTRLHGIALVFGP